MMAQYGVRMYSPEFREMTWEEFRSLLVGLNGDTPLGNLVKIRLEDDEKILKHFSATQRKIRDDWRRDHPCVNIDKDAHMQFLAQMQSFFNK